MLAKIPSHVHKWCVEASFIVSLRVTTPLYVFFTAFLPASPLLFMKNLQPPIKFQTPPAAKIFLYTALRPIFFRHFPLIS